jgi:hypothetical protein
MSDVVVVEQPTGPVKKLNQERIKQHYRGHHKCALYNRRTHLIRSVVASRTEELLLLSFPLMEELYRPRGAESQASQACQVPTRGTLSQMWGLVQALDIGNIKSQ